MARGQIAFLKALARKRRPSSLKPVFFHGAEVSDSGLSFVKLPVGFIPYRRIHSFPPSFADELHGKNGRPFYSIPLKEAHLKITESVRETSEIATDENNLDNGEYSAKHGESLENSEDSARVTCRDAVVLFQEMCQSTQPPVLSVGERQKLVEVLQYFAQSGWACDQALALYIKQSIFPTAASRFRNFLLDKGQSDVLKYLVELGPCEKCVTFLFSIFAEFCMKEFQEEISRFRTFVGSADLRKPHTWFPFARAMKRKIVYHCGPTNSGKTYNALQRFMQANSGIYCGPLRLLAMEVFDKVNALGVYCSLHTGQEKKNIPFSNHVSCTVEMASTEKSYEVAVLDEIQMLNDETRGYAWSRALLGLRADEIHLCGDPTALKLVREICTSTGDDLVEYHYGRFKPLVVEAKTLLGSFENIEPGDCIVAFSRRELFEVRMAIQKFTKHRCCIIYGALPPETRKQQANLFNDPNNEYDVLVASDAIGMGLNLNIRRVVFYSLQKYNGYKQQHVPSSQVKQIAGRAGRRGSSYPEGLTTTFQLQDLDYLVKCLQQPFEECRSVGLFPYFEQVELFAGKLPNISFAQLLDKFSESCQLDGSYFLCKHDHIKKVAHMLDKVPGLSLQDRYNFCYTPVNTHDPKAMAHLLRFAQQYSSNLPVRIAVGVPKGSARNDLELLDLETKHQILSMYLWLSHHFREETFPYKEKAELMAIDIADLLGQSLAKACWKAESRNRKRATPEPKKVSAAGRQLEIMRARAHGLVAC